MKVKLTPGERSPVASAQYRTRHVGQPLAHAKELKTLAEAIPQRSALARSVVVTTVYAIAYRMERENLPTDPGQAGAQLVPKCPCHGKAARRRAAHRRQPRSLDGGVLPHPGQE